MRLFEHRVRATRRRSYAAAVGLFALGLLAVLMVDRDRRRRTVFGSARRRPTASRCSPAPASRTPARPRSRGDIGTFPTTSISGSASMTVGGTNHAGDAVTQQAKNDLVTAYDTAAGEGPTNPIAADLGGRTLLPGVYNSASSIGLTGALTLNAAGRPERGLRLPGRLRADHGVGQRGQPDQRRPGLQRVLADRQLGDARHRFELHRHDHGADEHHRHHRRHDRRPRPRPQRCGHARHRHDHDLALRDDAHFDDAGRRRRRGDDDGRCDDPGSPRRRPRRARRRGRRPTPAGKKKPDREEEARREEEGRAEEGRDGEEDARRRQAARRSRPSTPSASPDEHEPSTDGARVRRPLATASVACLALARPHRRPPAGRATPRACLRPSRSSCC